MNVLKKQSRIKAINAACGKLKIGREERHAIQLQVTGKASLTVMTLPELDDVLGHFNRIAGGPRKALSPQQKKIWSLWQQLADRGLVRDRRMVGLMAWVKRQAGVDALAFLTWPQEYKITESLKRWLARGVEPTVGEVPHA